MAMFSRNGPRTRRLVAFLHRRARARPALRPTLDCHEFPALFRKRAIVFTDTADFTTRTLRDGILHFLMVFSAVVAELRPVLRRAGAELVKVEGDSLLLLFRDAKTACRGVIAIEACLRQRNRRRPDKEQLRFSYGIGYGEVLDIEGDVFGLEVNLASKLGEDMAKPGEALLTPAAAGGLDARTRARLPV